MKWKSTAYLLCVYGMIRKFRPATPFLTPFLVSDYKNFTDAQLYSQVYPFWTYSYLFALIPIFFLTDILHYKPIVMLEAMSFSISSALIIWGTKLWQMQIMEIIFGLSSASEIAYFSYMYGVVDHKHFKRITSYVRATTLVGKFLAYGMGQLLISANLATYLQLNQISFGSSCTALLITFMLPSITTEMIANKVRSESVNDMESAATAEALDPERAPLNVQASPTVDRGMAAYFRDVWTRLKVFKDNRIILKWSIWWALTGCGTFQVQNYVQNLWASMQRGSKAYNGITECASTLIGAIVAFLVQYMRIDWAKRGEAVLLINSIISAGILIMMSQTENVFVAYSLYVAFAAIYQLLITAASANIAAQLNTASYGLVFGWNTFVALFLQTALTLAVADKHGLALDIRTQFVIYGCYFGAVAAIFLGMVIWKLLAKTFVRGCTSVSPYPKRKLSCKQNLQPSIT